MASGRSGTFEDTNRNENKRGLKSRLSQDGENSRSRRWSFTDKSDNEDETMPSIENIENHSPNMCRGIKRSHSKSEIWDNKSQELSTSCNTNCIFSPSKLSNIELKVTTNVSIVNDEYTFHLNTNETNDSHIENVKNGSNEQMNLNSAKYIGERKRFEDVTNFACNQNHLVTSDKKSNSFESKIHSSPLPSCCPHPPFHQYNHPFSRHTTFEEDICQKDNDLQKSGNSVNDGEFNQNASENESTSPEINLMLNFDSKSPGVGIESLPETSDHQVFEKECFVSNNLSFCDSLKDACCSPSDSHNSNYSDDENLFSKLFDENVLSIFQWLPKQTLVKCMLVCKRWHRLALNSRLWSRVCLGGKVLKSGVIPNLMSRHPIVIRLANAQLTAPVIPANMVPSFSWRVQFLDLSAASIAPSCLAAVLDLCPGLLRLSLEGLTLSEVSSTSLGKLTQLKVLNLALATGLGMEGVRSISNLKNIEALNIAWTGLKVEEMQFLCCNLPLSTQRLNLSGFRKSLTDEMVANVVKKCPNLVEFDLSDCVLLSEDLMPVLKNLKKLEHLAISRCYKLQMADIALLATLPSLQCVDIFGLVTPETLPSFQCLLPKIQINNFIHSGIARPTVGNRRTSIWGLRTRD